MNSIVRKLGGGGDIDVEKMIETATGTGIDLIELLWTKDTGTRPNIAKIIGFKFPIVSSPDSFSVDINVQKWVDGQLKFYPDQNGRCWGYVYDIPENRKLLCSGLSNGWYKIVDKKIKEEIEKEAKELGFNITITPKMTENVKKTFREVAAEKHAKELENKLHDMEEKMNRMKKDLEITKNERQVHIENRIKGTEIPVIDKPIDEPINIKKG